MSPIMPSNNDSSQDSASMGHYSPETLVTLFILFVTMLLGVPGNGLVIWVTSMKMKRTVNTIWFWNLAVADIICCLAIPFSASNLLLHGKWPYGSFLCKVLPSIIILNMFASVFILVAISVDRCLVVVKPVWAQNHRTVRSACLICLGIWLLSFLMCLPAVIYRETVTDENITYCINNYGPYYDEILDYDYFYNSSHTSKSKVSLGTTDSYELDKMPDMISGNHPTEELSQIEHGMESPNADIIITISRAIVGFFFPFLIICTCYTWLALKLQHSRFVKVGRKTRKVAIGIVLAFCVCWVPYHIIGLIRLYIDSEVLDGLDILSQALAYANSCVNPVLYVFMGKNFKRKVQQSFRGLMESAFSEELTRTTGHSRSKDSSCTL
ncbi:C3a anaphylatoxin chemotactic receptor [Discoglossus pictus]